ncbi:DUF192 domain-containing protein [Ostreibacterium oceani]|uniref:DUF192 domain-containing protein n=1 Tax=Ostreibacterium oceani TaxID=2654998 RepID=A0A6N7F0A9_9GAMM|nr:DUF192 domain-containing protein [Ostreibacterium oceani]MPV86837.1 hypothetical protein [Ostreibacterium oceani]
MKNLTRTLAATPYFALSYRFSPFFSPRLVRTFVTQYLKNTPQRPTRLFVTRLISLSIVFLCLNLPAANALERDNKSTTQDSAAKFQENYNSLLYLGEHQFELEIANTSQTMQKGMMHRPSMQANQAMIFVFPAPRQVSFWMKNTLIPLDMLFFDTNGVLKEIKHNVPPCRQAQCPTYPSATNDIQYVVEIKGGEAKKRNLQIGQRFYACGWL